MIKWSAFFMAWFALVFTPSDTDFHKLKSRIEGIERRQCLLMVVLTPTGQATVCAVQP